MSYHSEMFAEAKKLLKDTNLQFTPECNLLGPEYSSCRYSKQKRICLYCAIWTCKDKIWHNINVPYEQLDIKVNPFKNYDMLTWLNNTVKRCPSGKVIMSREQAIEILDQMSRLFTVDYSTDINNGPEN